MHTSSLIHLLFLSAIVFASRRDSPQATDDQLEQRCPNANEVWRDCGLDPKCKHCDFHAEPCNTACYTGCTCKDGYMYDTLWRCIPQEACIEENVL
ncbi:unnamed protein product, partial [Mesorhabditis belari]|uniref:TIL domain-containing protein n=1 Tax=Mesorhabditis belari TaxID=2138241 RepID=A0AAF3ERT0_9BILA